MSTDPDRKYEYPNAKVSDLIYRTPAINDFEPRDLLDLAMACLDQAGNLVEKRDYNRILTMLGASMTPAVHRVSPESPPSAYRGVYPVVFVSQVSRHDPECDNYEAASVDLYTAPRSHEDGCEVVIPEGSNADDVIGAELLKRWGVTLPASGPAVGSEAWTAAHSGEAGPGCPSAASGSYAGGIG